MRKSAFNLLKTLVVSIGLMLMFGHSTFAQPHFINYTNADGLPSDEVHCVYQDSKGFMWFGTDRGLVRFDGYKFKVYSREQGLTDDVIFQLWEDHKGRLWMITLQRHVLVMENGKVRRFQHEVLDENFVYPEYAKKPVCLEKSGKRWVIPTTRYTLIFDHESDQVEALKDNPFGFIVQNIENEFVISGETGGVENQAWEYEYSHAKLLDYGAWCAGEGTYDLKEERGFSGRGGACSMVLNGCFYIGFTNLLIELEQSNCVMKMYHMDRSILTLHAFEDLLWMGMRNEGILIFDPKRKEVVGQFLKGNTVSAIYWDDTGGIWATTVNKGVFYCKNLDIGFGELKDLGARFSDEFMSMVTWQDSTLFAGTRGGNLMHLSVKRTGGLQLEKKAEELVDFSLLDLHLDKTESVLYSTSKSPDYCLKDVWNVGPVTWKPHCGGDMYSHWNSLVVRDRMSCDKREKYWFSNLEDFRLRNGIETPYRLGRMRPLDLHEDRQGNKRWSMRDGLFKRTKNQAQWERDTTIKELKNVLVERIEELKDGRMVYATRGKGIIIQQGDSVLVLDKTKGLISDNIIDLWVNDQQELFLVSNAGLNILTENKGLWDVETWASDHGIPYKDIRMVRSNGRYVWMLSKQHVIVLDRLLTVQDQQVPRLHIEKIMVNDSVLSPNFAHELSYKQNFLEVDYVALRYQMEGNIKYQYRFKNKDTTWTNTTLTSLQFPSLMPDAYTLEIRAANEHGLWTEPLTLNVEILAPYWKRWWFQWGIFIVVFSGIISFFRYRLKQSRERNAMLKISNDLMQKQQTLNYSLNSTRQQMLAQQMNPHFIFNSLNSIQRFILNRDTQNSSYYLGKFAKLIRRVLENAQTDCITLEEELGMLKSYIELEQMRMDHRFQYTIELDEDLEEEQDMVGIPNLLLQPYIENSIWHGFSDAERKDYQLTLSFQLEDDVMICQVKDNGVGFQTKTEEERKKHRSLGTKITQERVRLLNELHQCNIQVERFPQDEVYEVIIELRYDWSKIKLK